MSHIGNDAGYEQQEDNFLEDCTKYLSAELSDNPGIDFDGSGVYLTLPSLKEVKK